MPGVPMINVTSEGAVLRMAPATGTVTTSCVLSPTESVMTSVVSPVASPVIDSVAPETLALATNGLLLLTRYKAEPL